MKNTKIMLSAIDLWFFGLFIAFFKKIISAPVKINASLSGRHTVLAFRAYERLLFLWYAREKKHLLLLTTAKKL